MQSKLRHKFDCRCNDCGYQWSSVIKARICLMCESPSVKNIERKTETEEKVIVEKAVGYFEEIKPIKKVLEKANKVVEPPKIMEPPKPKIVARRVTMKFNGETLGEVAAIKQSPSPQKVPPSSSPCPAGLKLRQASDNPHIIVDALAGTGKTFTILEAAYRILGINRGVTGTEEQEAIWDSFKSAGTRIQPSDLSLIAFNSSIASELKEKVPPGVNASTAHAFGKRLLAINGVKGARVKYGVRKQKTFYIVGNMHSMDVDALFRSFRAPILMAIKQFVGFCKLNLVIFTGDFEQDRLIIDQLADAHGAILPEFKDDNEKDFFYYHIVEAYLKSHEMLDYIDFDDMVWLPWKLNLELRPVQLMFVDERQDLNIAQQELVCRAANRLVLVGDVNQAIYGFAGADAKACQRMEDRLSGPGRGIAKFPLTLSYRCAKRIVEYNQSIVPSFGYFEDAEEGAISKDREETFLNRVVNGDMIVCRTNAPLFACCLQLLQQGRPFKTTVKSFFEQTINLVKSFDASNLFELQTHLSEWKDRQLERCTGKYQDRAILILDQYRAIKAAMEVCKSPEDLIAKIEKVFDLGSEDKVTKVGDTHIFLSSIHSAKGLEANKVWWLQYDQVPHPKARLLDQERNLKWVAGTRAMNELVEVQSAKRKGEEEE